MNHYGPRQREKDKRWDYCCENDGIIWPVGYCRAYKDLADDPLVGDMMRKDELELKRSLQHKHHTGGHASPEEAQACFREYQLDQNLRLSFTHPDTQFRCQVCGEWTQLYAQVGHLTTYDLCAQHNNRAEVEKLYGLPGEIISSW